MRSIDTTKSPTGNPEEAESLPERSRTGTCSFTQSHSNPQIEQGRPPSPKTPEALESFCNIDQRIPQPGKIHK
jgi:hypothetical protein